ncbi:HAMP domain-containing sensor histidine kinase [Nocardioides sp.]|uniref:sensor histidine kinase n=1 Tax=Nocardioides sp. TaxID=35761 RepID=UPI00321C2CB9
MAPATHEHAERPAQRPSPEGAADAPSSSPGPDPEPEAGSARADPRVAAVLEVLGGAPLSEVATTWSVDPTLLQRWTTAFVGAGTAQVLNRPEAQALAQRERFLAAFAFEIRTPLTVAMGWSGLLAEGDLPSMSFLRTARRLQETLALLADRLVDVELLVAAAMGGLQVTHRAVTAGEVCRLPDVGAIGGTGASTELYVDPSLFTRVLADLWDAALHAPSPRSRRIEVVVEESWVEVRIVREGDPIATETLQAMFEPFEFDQLHSGVTTGLYLARALTVAHGGTLGVDQDDERAVLWVKVPLRPDGVPLGAPVTEPAAAHNSGGSR